MLYGGIEAGGTKFICAVAQEDGTIVEKIQIPTTYPEETLKQVVAFLKKFELKAIGIGSFGPIDINQTSPTYGWITSTPKISWRDYPIVQKIEEAFKVPVGFNTDVNAAALGEATYGAAKGLDNCLYITVGTGIGAGAFVQGMVVQGLTHPEMGHIFVRRHPDDQYIGKCPFHQDCLEGLASGPAINERWGKNGIELANDQKVWEMEGYYIAQALMQYILILSPKKIILGGGVMKQKQLFPIIFKNLQKLLNGYVSVPELANDINQYIVSPGLGDNAGITGSLLLGKQAFEAKIN